MTTIRLPDPDLLAVPLEPFERVVLGGGESAQTQHGRLSLGRPSCYPLDLATVDDDGARFLRSRPASRFYLLELTSSFVADDENPLVSAWVDVGLAAVDPPDATAPVAWSMSPVSPADAVKVTRTVTLGASLKLTLPLIPVDAGPSAERSREESFEVQDVALEALHEGTARPTWRFSPTVSRQIRGKHDLRLVVEMPATGTARAEVSVGATIRLRRFKVLRYPATLPDDAAVLPLPPG